MNGQIQPQQLQPLEVQAPPGQVTAQSLQAILAAIMAVWVGAFVLSQVLKVFKGEEIEKPPLIPE